MKITTIHKCQNCGAQISRTVPGDICPRDLEAIANMRRYSEANDIHKCSENVYGITTLIAVKGE